MEDKVLFIGADSPDREQIRHAFIQREIRSPVEFIPDVQAGLEAVMNNNALAVFVMHAPPANDGFRFLAELKANKLSMPVVLVSTGQDEDFVLKALRKGAYDCITEKDGVIDALPVCFKRALARFEMHKQKAEVEMLVLESQKEWIALFDGITDFIFMADEQQRIVRANRSLAEAFGRHPKEILGIHCHELFGMMISDSRCFDIENGQKRTEERTINDETYMISSFPLHYENQQWVIYIMKNITEMKRLKEQLYHSDKLASIGLLTAGVAHEINNPLTGIIAYTELLMMKVSDEDIRRELKKIFDSAERCTKIVENLLTFSRQRVPSNSIESVNDIIDRAIALRGYWLRSSNIEIVREYGETPTVFIDSQQIQQVILNVLLNAEQAINSTGNREGKITFVTKYNTDSNRIIIRISDNGPGIPQDILAKIFDPFFTTKSVGVGTGLGLSISHGIITEHGGSIRAETAEGGGASFVIELPSKAGKYLVASDYGSPPVLSKKDNRRT